MNSKIKKFIKLIMVAAFIAVLASFGALWLNFYAFPKLSTYSMLSKYAFLKKAAENTTIINRTEQITVKDDSSVDKIASQASSATVEIVSIPTSTNLNAQKTSLGQAIAGKDGNGIIVTSDGVIATYRTAIDETNSAYKIILLDGAQYDATLLGIDEFTDIAYLKVNNSNLPIISFANSDDSVPGKKLIAIAKSLDDYQSKFSSGLLSNINKTFNISGKALASSEKLEGVFEIDFANQNEYIGGPVINYSGDLIGLIGSVTVDNQKKFFAIPANQIRKSMDLMTKNQLSNRPVLGAYYISITENYNLINRLDLEKGARVFSTQGISVLFGSPADKAGLKNGDVIKAVNDKEVNLNNPLSNLVNDNQKGSQIQITILRNGQELKLPVQL
jgi:serine protease Do